MMVVERRACGHDAAGEVDVPRAVVAKDEEAVVIEAASCCEQAELQNAEAFRKQEWPPRGEAIRARVFAVGWRYWQLEDVAGCGGRRGGWSARRK